MAGLHQFTTKELLQEVESRKEDMKCAFSRLLDEMYESGFTYEDLKETLDNH